MRRALFILIALQFFFNSLSAQIVDAKEGENGKYGFVDKRGNWVVRPIYLWAYWSEEEQYGIFNNSFDEGEGMVNMRGKVIIPSGKYASITAFYDANYKRYKISLTDANSNKKTCGVVDVNGKTILQFGLYSSIFPMLESPYIYLKSMDEKTVGIADALYNVIIPVGIYEKIFLQENTFYVEKGGKRGVLDLRGNVLVPLEYDFLYIYEKYIIVIKQEASGILDHSGNILLSLDAGYNYVTPAADNIFLVEKDGKYGYYANGTEIIPCQYDEATIFKNDVATVKKDGQVKLIKNPLKDGSGINIASSTPTPSGKKKDGPAQSRYPAPNSDVDKDIPATAESNENTFAFIIANENYPDAPVPYALNDGRIFKEYCAKTLGIPEKNISLYEDATFGSIIAAVEKMKGIADAYEGEASVVFYYAGHGFPDEKQSTAYLLPVDGNASDITATGYSLGKLYKEMSAMKLKSAVVFLDACFSGAKREDDILASSRGVAIKVKEEAPQGSMIVFSAAQGDETAHQLAEKGHGLFTYYLLKGLQQSGGDINLGYLSDYVTKQVKRQSVIINNKKQTPTVIPSASVAGNWRTMKLK